MMNGFSFKRRKIYLRKVEGLLICKHTFQWYFPISDSKKKKLLTNIQHWGCIYFLFEHSIILNRHSFCCRFETVSFAGLSYFQSNDEWSQIRIFTTFLGRNVFWCSSLSRENDVSKFLQKKLLSNSRLKIWVTFLLMHRREWRFSFFCFFTCLVLHGFFFVRFCKSP